MWDDASKTLTALADVLEAFIDRWESWDGRDPPALASVLPPDAVEVRRLALIELVKIDLEYRWLKHNLPRRVEDYVQEFPELVSHGPPIDLLYEEFHLRRQAGLNVDPREYLQRFPDRAEELGRLLGLTATHSSTAMGRRLKARQLPEFQPGERIDDFVLLAFLGKGAFAQVFLARQQSMQRLVALKITADSGDEPQTLAQLDHDHIVRVYDLRSVPEKKVQLLYMQYLAGGTLQCVVERVRETLEHERTGRLLLQAVDRMLDDRGETAVDSSNRRQFSEASWPSTVALLGAKLARALGYAHSRRVLHRDIKPANVLLTADASPKLADFNISFSSDVVGSTPDAFFGGSLGYMSPEQLEAFHPAHDRRPDSLDGRSDLYSLGVMLWELLTGRRPFAEIPFRGDWNRTLDAMIQRRRDGLTSEDLLLLPASCPPGLRRVLVRCLHPDADARWQSGDELARQLELCTQEHAEALLYPPPQTVRARLRPWAVPVIILAAAAPNLLATVFNVLYNWATIIREVPRFEAVFTRVMAAVNLVAYPVGLGTLAWLAWTVSRTARRAALREEISEHELAWMRRRCLRLGHYAAVIGVLEWFISGMMFPVMIHIATGVSPPYLHFLASLVLCGLIAAAYPFFAITLFAIRTIYPAFRPAESGCELDRSASEQLGRMAWGYLLSAAAVPLLGVAMLAVGMAMDGIPDRSKVLALSVLGVSGLAGLGLLFPGFRMLQRDLETLREVCQSAP